MRAVILDLDTMGADISLDPLKECGVELVQWSATSAEQVKERIAGAEIVITNKVPISAEVIKEAPALSLICVLATGTNNIDMQAAEAAGIPVRNVTAYGTPSISQHTFGLIIALANRLKQVDREMAAGAWQRSATIFAFLHPMTQLAGKQLTIVGSGELGRAVAKLAEAFDMQVVFTARPGNNDDTRPPLQDVLPDTDVLSLHCPLTEATRGLINADNLTLLKPGALLVNCARGGVINETDALAALRSGHLGGLAVDVLPEEPPRGGHPLLEALNEDLNLLVTPHMAWGTQEARQRVIELTSENIKIHLDGCE
ncbi:D-2-hydroxyacid dehydrogenase [Carnimonas nigrificans]|uniref:D-2-hydroxyacid dehydrogenase n=1 Tax=Carnimonas nigrificans TaxID=64323 RepID=UPI0004712C29|nr:D-2-hydroxyacid dehydrogenase [Carnimonas nigrificans]